MKTPRLPPSFPEGERALLGACLLDNSMVSECCSMLLVGDFYHEPHRLLFNAISELNRRDVPVDWVSVTETLRAAKTLETCGGAVFLAELADAVPSAANWRHYAKKVKEYSRLRNIIWRAGDALDTCYAPEPNIPAIAEVFQDIAYNATRDTQTNKPRDVGETIGGFTKTRQRVRQAGISTGLTSIDNVIGGFRPGSLVAISARPSMGKSSLAMTMARSISMERVCCFFSQEMTEEQLHVWLVSAESGIDGHRLVEGGLSDFEIERAERAERKISTMALYIDDSPAQTVGQISSKVKDLAISTGQVDVVIVDHLRLCRANNPRDPQYIQLGQISEDLKSLSKRLNLTVVALVQLNREIEKRPLKGGGRIPRAYDLRGSGEIEENVDIHMGLYRPERYIEEMDSREKADLVPINKALLNIDKNRLGRTGRADLLWNGPTTTFSCPHSREDDQFHMEAI